jgi:purine-nucleoside/S-methyl-5'-thioadenosine phosphorylase / adenosine deaminase
MDDKKYQFKIFLDYPHIIHGISTKSFGSMKKDDGGIDYDNLECFTESLGIKNKVVTMKQIHSGIVSVIKNDKEFRIPETDGLITDKKNIPLAVLTADCLPVLFYDSKREVIGVAHAGYKGLLNNILKNMILEFTLTFRSNPKDIIVGIGPGIEAMCYEVGEEVIEKFNNTFPTFENMYSKKNGKFFLDLQRIALQCLGNEGILKENREVMNICTRDNEDFYSYRGGDKDARFASIISLK